MITPEQAVQTFSTNFQRVIYNEPGTFPSFSGKLAPLTGVYLGSTYSTGQLLGYYNVHAPMGLAGQFINYSAASANADQNVAVAILIEEWVSTAGGDGNFYKIAYLVPPLVLSGTVMALANESADITAFLAAYTPFQPLPGSLVGPSYDGNNDQAYILK